MLLRVTFSLVSSSVTPGEKKKFPENEEIVDQLDTMGHSLPPKRARLRSSKLLYETVHFEPGSIVDFGSVPHFRDLAIKNCTGIPLQKFSKEIEKYCIYFGSVPESEALFFVNRVSQGSISILILQKEIASLNKSAQKLVDQIVPMKCIATDGRSAGVTVYSTKEGDEVAEGSVERRNLTGFLMRNKVQFVGAMIMSFLAVMLTAALLVHEAGLVLLPSFIFSIAKTLSAAAIGGSLSMIVSLFAIYSMTNRETIRWNI
jgi:hypothetical protein